MEGSFCPSLWLSLQQPRMPSSCFTELFLPSACLLDPLCLLKAASFVRRFADEPSGMDFWFSWRLLPGQALVRAWLSGALPVPGARAPGPERHTVSDVQGEAHSYQMQSERLNTVHWFCLPWPLPTVPPLALNTPYPLPLTPDPPPTSPFLACSIIPLQQ